MKTDLDHRDAELKKEIVALKKKLSPTVVILGHHYQREEIVNISDFVGDSYYLAKKSSELKEAKKIVFCGVRFMAEAASILCRADQEVFHPDEGAGCPLSDMADFEQVEKAWNEIGKTTDINEVIPVTYINSSAELKAFCGRNGGVVCTSSNAKRAMDWAFSKGKKLFFFPDQHLGRNTAFNMGIKGDDVILWDFEKDFGGNSKKALMEAKIILWRGFCHVHTFFSVDDVRMVREKFRGVQVIVHPECKREVVDASDGSGSTSYLVDYVEKAKKGSIIAIGTEINLVSRLAKANRDKKVIELKRSLCPNMFKITLDKLLFTLRNLDSISPVSVPGEIKRDALKALQRMLEV